MELNLANTIAGFGVGAAVGMTGVGGGALMTPLLVLMFGFAPATAVGTDLWFAAITKMVGGTLHNHKGGVDWQVLRRMALGSIPACIITLIWMDLTRTEQSTHGTIIHALGVVLFITAIAMLVRKKIQSFGARLRTTTATAFLNARPLLTVLAGVVLGVIVFLAQRKYYGDDKECALIKALIVALLTAIPSPLPYALFVPAGVVGFFRRKK